MVTGVNRANPVGDDESRRITTALSAALKDALRARDAAATSALRTALGAIGNAESVAPSLPVSAPAGNQHFAGAVSGLGAGEVARRHLSAAEVEAIVRAEITERERAADDYSARGLADQADRLRREARVLRAVMTAP